MKENNKCTKHLDEEKKPLRREGQKCTDPGIFFFSQVRNYVV